MTNYLKFKYFILIGLLFPNIIKSQECLFQGCTCEYKQFTQDYDVLCTSKSPPQNEYFPLRIPSSTIVNINTLLINYYDFKRTPSLAFNGLSIRSLVFVGNNIEALANDTFKSITSLNSLTIVEPRLTLIESNTFSTISDMLDELIIARLESNPEYLINSFMIEFSRLRKLRKLSLTVNGLTKFDPNILSIFPILEELKLSYNKLKSIPIDTFKLSPNLKLLDLSRNELTKMSDLFNTLEPIKHTLEQLYLASNKFDIIPDMGNYSKLGLLDLSSNKINTTNISTFKALTSLNYLNLGANYLEKVDSNTFSANKNLEVLLLNDNLLSALPNIYNLDKLSLLDLSNQKNLKLLPNYVFERKTWINRLTVNLKGIDVGFENKIFCTQDQNKTIGIRSLMLSYQTFKIINKCVLKQIVTKSFDIGILIEIDSSPVKTNYTELCNCDLKNFAKNSNISFKGVCENIFNMSCNDVFVDDCSQKRDFQCLDVSTASIPKYTTSSNLPTALGLKNVSTKICFKNFLLFLVIHIYLIFK